ncbi:thiamine pyrophosphate-dependent enzyme [candidate division CSSED10-310 bacterium]|uniref:Thiamine pyrophosphate-dependent enzyme n=1 Tax=candidate division CSSED10-310 bacterium TaxID=2855610 RepID=A0ABV6YVC3_UNCC1
MPEIKILTGTQAAAFAAKLARPGVIAAYPITPQTATIEYIAEFVANGSLDCEYVKAESEHSVLAICITASQSGVRTFTATSSQGLAYMHEMVFWAAGSRTPVVMANINRCMGPPWSIYSDQNDSLAERDTGWIQFYCESCQEVLDTTIMAFRFAEKVALPAMISMDAFFLSHTGEPVELPDQDIVDQFLPEYFLKYKLDVENPVTFGALVAGEGYMELRKAIDMALEEVLTLGKDVFADFKRQFGRSYSFIEAWNTHNADIVVATTGTITSTAREVVKALRQEGMNVGLLKIYLARPFPKKLVISALKGVKKVAVLDRNISFGSGGIFAQEIKDALYNSDVHPDIYSYIVGLGGRDVTPETVYDLIMEVNRRKKPSSSSTWVELLPQAKDLDVPAMLATNENPDELVHPGGRGCPGCGAALGLIKVMQVLGKRTMVAIPACCSSIITGAFPNKMLEVPTYHTAFATAAAAATGMTRSLKHQNIEDVTVITWAGDGGTYDIGIQALSGAAERNEDFIYICYDNEAYMNTGIQRSSATPLGTLTTTTPYGALEDSRKKNIMDIMTAHGIPYCATASVAYPDDLMQKIETAKTMKGTRFILIFSPCPPGHKYPSHFAIKIARLAVQTRIFPLYEVINGEQYQLTVEHKGIPVKEYFKLQGRFMYLTESELMDSQKQTDYAWERLKLQVEMGQKLALLRDNRG